MVSWNSPYHKSWHILCFTDDSACLNLWGDIMSEFSILYKSLHCEQKRTKKTEKNDASSQVKSEAQSGSTVNPLRALIAKIF